MPPAPPDAECDDVDCPACGARAGDPCAVNGAEPAVHEARRQASLAKQWQKPARPIVGPWGSS